MAETEGGIGAMEVKEGMIPAEAGMVVTLTAAAAAAAVAAGTTVLKRLVIATGLLRRGTLAAIPLPAAAVVMAIRLVVCARCTLRVGMQAQSHSPPRPPCTLQVNTRFHMHVNARSCM